MGSSAPTREWKTECSQTVYDCGSKHSKTEHTDPSRRGLLYGTRLPFTACLLLNVSGKVAVQRQHCKRHIFLHHPNDAVLNHAHKLHMIGQTGAKLIYSRTDRKQYFKIGIPFQICRGSPRQEIADLLRRNRITVCNKTLIWKYTSELGSENSRTLCIGIEQEDHMITPNSV